MKKVRWFSLLEILLYTGQYRRIEDNIEKFIIKHGLGNISFIINSRSVKWKIVRNINSRLKKNEYTSNYKITNTYRPCDEWIKGHLRRELLRKINDKMYKNKDEKILLKAKIIKDTMEIILNKNLISSALYLPCENIQEFKLIVENE